MKRVILCILFVAFSISIMAQTKENVQKQTYLYSTVGDQKLYLDRYVAENKIDVKNKPCLIFMFGGGFVTGERDRKDYIPFFEDMAERGFVVVSIDYRLGLKGFVPKEDSTPIQFAVKFVETIAVAVEDLFNATSYVYNNAEKWGVNQDIIVASGSSAGAISVLQGEFEISNATLITQLLPAGFNYAGIIGFAGAILSPEELSFDRNPCPIMMFHGDADANVPYGVVREMDAGFYGSSYIAKYLDAIDAPYWFWSQENATHSLATKPMRENRDEIVAFINKLVINKEPLKLNTNASKIGAPILNKEFSVMDYVRANFGE